MVGVLGLLVVVMLVVGCGDQGAKDRAEAERIEAEARRLEQEAADEAAARAAAEARRQADWEATRAAVYLFKQIVVIILAAVVSFVAIFLAVIGLLWLRDMSRVAVRFAERRAALRADMVRLDKATHTWPALVRDGAVQMLETGEVFLLGVPRAADGQQVAGSVLVRAIGEGTAGVVRIGEKAKDGGTADAIAGLMGVVPVVPAADRLREVERAGE
jgi:hypothetical protein